MIDAAGKLSDGMSFVRVDLYEINGQPRFGELTFYPASAAEIFDPPEYDRFVGSYW
jgi:TupA-like ATPgrasp